MSKFYWQEATKQTTIEPLRWEDVLKLKEKDKLFEYGLYFQVEEPRMPIDA
jgi:hypothetical protein